jgi:hypothetical protein
LYIFWVFTYTTKKIKYVVDRGILGKLEVALGQQKSAQTCSNSMKSCSGWGADAAWGVVGQEKKVNA